MVIGVLSEAERCRIDESDDALFYAEPRFVQHLDEAFRARLTRLYRECLPADGVVLDLMSSWVSHLPEEVRFREVIGHGLNRRELEANPRLDRHWLQDLNREPRLPLEDASVDAALIVAGWQYLRQPEPVAAELLRILRPGGRLIVAFSNRMFFQKAPRAWLEGSDRDRLTLVAKVLMAQGWPLPRCIAEETAAPGPLGWIGVKGDPFFAVVAERPAAGEDAGSGANAAGMPAGAETARAQQQNTRMAWDHPGVLSERARGRVAPAFSRGRSG